jgi:hypothetical protein
MPLFTYLYDFYSSSSYCIIINNIWKSYQEALDYEVELRKLIDLKQYNMAFEIFDEKIFMFMHNIKQQTRTMNEDDDVATTATTTKVYLRKYTSGSVYCKIISQYAIDVLQRLKMYPRANELFMFLLFDQNDYLQDYKISWYCFI